MTQKNKRWNIFARELEDILIAHNLHLGLLDGRIDIHQEKVRRLQQSLLRPKSFPVLNPEEIEHLIQTFDLSEEERVRLRAALLATAIERMLMDRIGWNNALQASEQIYTIVHDILLVQFEQEGGLDSNRGGDVDSIEDTEEDRVWRRAWNALDEANMALQLSYHVTSYRQEMRKIREAQECFLEALTELDSLDEDWKSLQNWKNWRNEAQAGFEAAKERLQDLEEK